MKRENYFFRLLMVLRATLFCRTVPIRSRVSLFFESSMVFIHTKVLGQKEVSLRGRLVRTAQPKYFFHTYCEIFLLRVYAQSKLPSNARIIDCGAQIGLASIFFKTVAPDSEIICFEPEKSSFDCLVSNLKNYSCITCHQYALSNEEDMRDFFSLPGDPHSSFHFSKGSQSRVETKKLSSFIPNYSKVDLIKIDVESGEFDILVDIVESGIEAKSIIIEVHDDSDKCLDYLNQNNYKGERFKTYNSDYDGNSFIVARRELIG